MEKYFDSQISSRKPLTQKRIDEMTAENERMYDMLNKEDDPTPRTCFGSPYAVDDILLYFYEINDKGETSMYSFVTREMKTISQEFSYSKTQDNLPVLRKKVNETIF